MDSFYWLIHDTSGKVSGQLPTLQPPTPLDN